MHNPKKKLLLLFVSLILLSSSKCTFRPSPDVELCGAYRDGGVNLTCNDARVEPNDYERELQVGDVCTSVDDYNTLRTYCEALRVDLKKCKRKNR